MDAVRWQRAKEVFEAALERGPADRHAFILEACAGDNSLQREVESLLSGHERAGSFLNKDFRARDVSMDDGINGHRSEEDHHTFSPDKVLCGRFKVVRFISKGGMGEVYEARDLELGDHLALKTIRPEISANPENLQRFKQEIQLARKVTHPNVCRIFDLEYQRTAPGDDGDSTEIVFLTMELLEGETLAAWLRRRGRASTFDALPLVHQMAEGLAAAHDAGVIHRDFKPSNVILVQPVEAGLPLRPVVTDFGLARGTAPRGSATTVSSGSANHLLVGDREPIGTLAYMAPEQLTGGDLTTATDIYALGLVMYEMVTGHRLFFMRISVSDAAKHLNDPIPPPSVFVPELDPKWEAVVMRCLQTFPGLRYQSARALLSDLEEEAPQPAPRRWRQYALVAAAMLALLVGLSFHRIWDRFNRVRPSPIKSVAVLPLEDLSGRPDQDYFAQGMTEVLITDLARISALRVISRTSVMQYQGTHKPVAQVARELKVDAVVEGSVLLSGGRVRITARLIDARTDTRIWGDDYERDLRDVLALQSEVATTIADAIRIRVTSQEHQRLASARPVNTAAYDAYLRGRYEWNKGTERGKLQARDFFEQAATIDPDYAPAYSGLADYYSSTDELPPIVAKTKAKQYALKALKIDPNLAEAYTSLGFVEFYGDWNWAQADAEYKQALALDPGDADAHRLYSDYLSSMGRGDRAVEEGRAAERLDPVSVYAQVATGWALYYARRYPESLAKCTAASILEPDFATARDCMALNYLTAEDYEKARAQSQRAVKLSNNDFNVAADLARAYALGGNQADARKILQQLRVKAKTSYVPPSLLAQIYVALGENEKGVEWLETAYADRDSYLARLKVEPAFDSVRSEPDFEALMHQLSFPP